MVISGRIQERDSFYSHVRDFRIVIGQLGGKSKEV